MYVRWTFACAVSLTGLALSGCLGSGPDEPGRTDSEVHWWLAACDTDAECGEEYACVCNVCTAACADNGTCNIGTCLSGPSYEAECGTSTSSEPGICVAECADDADCRSVSAASYCDGGICRVSAASEAQRCGIRVSAPLGEFSPDFDLSAACDCATTEVPCHYLYTQRLDSIRGVSVTATYRKSSAADNPLPSAAINVWMLALDDEQVPICRALNDVPAVYESIWEAVAEHTVVFDAWPSMAAFDAAPVGETRRFLFVTGQGADPTVRTWFSDELLVVTKVCE